MDNMNQTNVKGINPLLAEHGIHLGGIENSYLGSIVNDMPFDTRKEIPNAFYLGSDGGGKKFYVRHKRTVRTTLLIIIFAFLLVITTLASIGISSLTKDYNYFIFTTMGVITILAAAFLFAMVKLIKLAVSKSNKSKL